ncbi:MAG: GntR family transcriptional regulator [Clostridiales bacterium]|nr:GntR family transcriptional regulator [Clostridiales bacterium]
MIINESTTSLENKVYTQLEEDILNGRYSVGDSITEIAASKEYGVSRTPIRDALRKLENDGLVKITPNKGATVIGVSKEDLVDIYNIRMRLEGLAGSMAAVRMSQKEKESLKENVELSRFYAGKQNYDKLKELDTDFHEAIYLGCGSRTIYRTLKDLHANTRLYRKMSLSVPGRMEKSLDEHEEIMKAILASDSKLVDKLMHDHVKAALDNLLGALGKDAK